MLNLTFFSFHVLSIPVPMLSLASIVKEILTKTVQAHSIFRHSLNMFILSHNVDNHFTRGKASDA